MASVEQGRLVERAWPPRARRVAPANPENREGRAADQCVRTGRQEGVGEEGRVAFGRGQRVEQGRARAERGERHARPRSCGGPSTHSCWPTGAFSTPTVRG